MRASRLLGIMIRLQVHGQMTAVALAKQFEVSVRTIYRDIDALSMAGVPIYAEGGHGGGISLLDGYRTKLTGLGLNEAQALSVMSMPIAAQALGLRPEADSVSLKLLAALSPNLREEAQRLSAAIHIDTDQWYSSPLAPPILPQVLAAVLQSLMIDIDYESWKGIKQRTVGPLGLVLKAGHWYLLAQIEESQRIYKVAQIKSLRVSSTVFGRPKDFELAHVWQEKLNRFEADLRPHKAQVLASQEGLRRIAELGDYGREATLLAQDDAPSGLSLVTLPYESLDQVARLLAGLGPEVKCLGPPEVTTALIGLCQQIVLSVTNGD